MGINEELFNMINKEALYVVGVSGGPDSVFLLHLLKKQGYKVIIAHVNYHKRVESDLDQKLVEEYAENYHYPLVVLNIKDYTRENFQKQARELRYNFFIDTIKKYKAEAILLAHHQDDVLETILMQKERKLHHVYFGMKEISMYQGIPLIRPLLNITKEEILNHLIINHLEYCTDSSNLENNYLRNKIRNTVLIQYSKKEKLDLLKEASLLNQENEERNKKDLILLKESVKDNRLYYQKIGPKQLENVLYLFIKEYSEIPPNRISKEIINNCIHLMICKKGNSVIDLPVNHQFIKEYDNVYIVHSFVADISFSYTFDKIEEFVCPYFKLSQNGNDREGVLLKKEDFPITIRNFENGDVMDLSFGKKKVNRLFIDAKIGKKERSIWPILVNSSGKIVLIPKIAKNKDYLMEKPSLFVLK